MAWRRPGDKPLFEPMMVSLPTHICVTRPQWVLPKHAGLIRSYRTLNAQGPHFNIETVFLAMGTLIIKIRPSHPYDGISYTGKMDFFLMKQPDRCVYERLYYYPGRAFCFV